MADVFRQTKLVPIPPGAERATVKGVPCVRIEVGGKPTTCPVAADGTRYRKPVGKWHVRYRDSAGVEKREPVSTDKGVAKQILSERLRQVERRRCGLSEPWEEHAGEPLAKHVADYAAHLMGELRQARERQAGRVAALDAADAPFRHLGAALDRAAAAHLLAAGFYRHDRGPWRRRTRGGN